MREYFGLKYHDTTCAREMKVGLSIFLSIAYIMVVNPMVLSGCGIDYYSAFMATVITSFASTLLMAVYAKLPVVLAPGLSMNALFSLVTMTYFGGDYRITFLATYLSGVLFVLLVAVGLFEKIEKGIPNCVKHSVLAGLGMALIKTGLESVNFLVKPVSKETALVLVGVIVSIWLMRRCVKGAIIYGILSSCAVNLVFTVLRDKGEFFAGLKEIFDSYESFSWDWNLFFENCFNFPSLQLFLDSPAVFLNLLIVSFMFTIFHFTDSIGTTSSLFSLMEDRGTRMPEKYKRKAMQVNGISSVISGLMGTSTATTYAESAVGIVQGAKTGMAGLTVCVMLLVAGFVAPILQDVSAFVTAQALIVAGMMSVTVLKRMKNAPIFEGIIAAVTTVYIGLTFEIARGLIWSMSAYILCILIREKKNRGKRFAAWLGVAGIGICLVVFQNNLN